MRRRKLVSCSERVILVVVALSNLNYTFCFCFGKLLDSSFGASFVASVESAITIKAHQINFVFVCLNVQMLSKVIEAFSSSLFDSPKVQCKHCKRNV